MRTVVVGCHSRSSIFTECGVSILAVESTGGGSSTGFGATAALRFRGCIIAERLMGETEFFAFLGDVRISGGITGCGVAEGTSNTSLRRVGGSRGIFDLSGVRFLASSSCGSARAMEVLRTLNSARAGEMVPLSGSELSSSDIWLVLLMVSVVSIINNVSNFLLGLIGKYYLTKLTAV
jgi:hypothetical protein